MGRHADRAPPHPTLCPHAVVQGVFSPTTRISAAVKSDTPGSRVLLLLAAIRGRSQSNEMDYVSSLGSLCIGHHTPCFLLRCSELRSAVDQFHTNPGDVWMTGSGSPSGPGVQPAPATNARLPLSNHMSLPPP